MRIRKGLNSTVIIAVITGESSTVNQKIDGLKSFDRGDYVVLVVFFYG